jgi:hypothetical protein
MISWPIAASQPGNGAAGGPDRDRSCRPSAEGLDEAALPDEASQPSQ